MTKNYLHSKTTDLIIKAFYNVYNKLGYGFLKKGLWKCNAVVVKKNWLKCGSTNADKCTLQNIDYKKR